MKSPEKTLRAVATMKPVTMAIVRKDGVVDTVWSSQMAVIAPSFDGIDRRRPNLNKRLAVSRSRAGGGIMMMMWLLNFQENSADMVWWLSSILSHALPDKNSSLDDSEKMGQAKGNIRGRHGRKIQMVPDVNRRLYWCVLFQSLLISICYAECIQHPRHFRTFQ